MYNLDTRKWERADLTERRCRKIIEDSGYREDYLATSPTFYLFKMNYEPYSWIATYKENRDYLIQEGKNKEEDFIEYTYRAERKDTQLTLFEI